mmetsp:Transcript_86248/g.231006  ORF Transcript_86248/g.231006 Transcript_86248/m.231006 type:complete len:337 (+) Transcript_86248:800-1810(+)
MLGDLRHHPIPLCVAAVVQTPLHDAAPMTVCSNLVAVVPDGVEHEVLVGVGELLQTLLDHVVAIHVAHQAQDVRLQRLAELGHLGLVLGLRDGLDQPLHRPGAVHIQADTREVRGADVQQLGPLLGGDHLEDHLHEVVPERILHELHYMLLGLLEHTVDHLLLPVVQLLLQRPAPTLVLGCLVDSSFVFLPGQFSHDLLVHLPAALVGGTISRLPPRLACATGAAPAQPHPKLLGQHGIRQAEGIQGQRVCGQRVQAQTVQVEHGVQERIIESRQHRHVNCRQRCHGHRRHHSLRPRPQIGALGGVSHPLLEQAKPLLRNSSCVQRGGVQARGLHP